MSGFRIFFCWYTKIYFFLIRLDHVVLSVGSIDEIRFDSFKILIVVGWFGLSIFHALEGILDGGTR